MPAELVRLGLDALEEGRVGGTGADQVGLDPLDGVFQLPRFQLENVYAEPTSLLRSEREQYAAYLDSFTGEEAAR